MQRARDVMTRDVLCVAADTPVREIARLLLERGVSSAPVVDETGAPIGMVSEGDIIGRSDDAGRKRRDWWLALVAEGEALHPDYLASFEGPGHRARDVMATPVVTVTPDTDVPEIARLLATHGIKRVPVVLDGRVVGVVSRADLLRALAQEPSRPHDAGHGGHGLLGALGGHLLGAAHEEAPAAPKPAPAPSPLSAEQFRALVIDHDHEVAARRASQRQEAAMARRTRVKELIDHHVDDHAWQTMLHKARKAAQEGESEALIFTFPASLCSDGGRAINVPEPDWPNTLRGEAGEVYLRWQHELRPQGFHLAARILDFPGGLPGDVGLFLIWGG